MQFKLEKIEESEEFQYKPKKIKEPEPELSNPSGTEDSNRQKQSIKQEDKLRNMFYTKDRDEEEESNDFDYESIKGIEDS